MLETIDLETSGLPCEELNKTKVTELSVIAVKKDHLLETEPGSTPRVQSKLTLCFNPGKPISDIGTKATGLCNFLLEYEPYFNKDVANLIKSFFQLLKPPVCMIGHNGFGFDFPILKAHLEKFEVTLDVLCADSLYGFYDIMKGNSSNLEITQIVSSDPTLAFEEAEEYTEIASYDSTSMQNLNETTPKKQKIQASNVRPPLIKQKDDVVRKCCKSRKKLFYGDDPKPTDSYKLGEIYRRVMNRSPVNAHRAEVDCSLLLECAVVKAKQFVQWIDNNHKHFKDIKPMKIGVPIALLVATGALWGCTNPFIRRGSRGLRSVRAASRLGQARAEITFLLGNWRYVVPWLLNQAGSLAYLAVVQRAPLSLAVPVANSLAFAFTALTGAAAGLEPPLDAGSYLGIALIAAGTALCCQDKAD